jgi:hypothetical protein
MLACLSLRKTASFGFSLLFAGQTSLDTFLEDFRQSGKLSRYCAAKQFDVPPLRTVHRPIIIVGAPRSGATLLFETLAQCPHVWTIGGKSHTVLERGLPSAEGNRLGSEDADGASARVIKAAFLSLLRDCRGRMYLERRESESPNPVRFLEKTPKNSLRIPFLKAIFPRSRFVFIHRDPRANIGSLIDGWQSPRFTSYIVDGASVEVLTAARVA